MRTRIKHSVLLLSALALASQACSSGSSGDSADTTPPAPPSPPPPAANNPPTISGSPQESAVQNRVYSFVPSASDPDGDTLTFRVENAPGWLTFDESTGKISGLPQMQHVGTHADIALFVSDGELETALDPFAIEVLLSADGSLTLNWTPPTTSADGSALLDLAGYRVRWGSQPGDHPNFEQIDNPGIATIVIGDLLPGTYYFVITAFDTSNNESAASNEASGTVL